MRELWCIGGRRSGKDSIAALLVVYIACFYNHEAYLRPGERATCLLLAVDREQAQLVLRYIKALFASNPLLKPLIERETRTGLELTNSSEILIATSDYRSIRGRTICCAILDEVCFWVQGDNLSDVEIFNALRPSCATLPYSMIIGISSPYAKRGLAYQKYTKHFGQDDDGVLVIQSPSRTLNPTIPAEIIDEAMETDPEAAQAEWLGQFRSDVGNFVGPEILATCVQPGVFELPPQQKTFYVGFADVSGGSGGDSFCIAIAHREGDVGVLDLVREWRPPFSPSGVVLEACNLLKSYRIGSIESDRWGAAFVVEQFANHGVRCEQTTRTKSDLYKETLSIINSRRAKLLDNQRMLNQFLSLERRVSRFGAAKEGIDHPPGSHDDLANACAGALVNTTSGRDFLSTWLLCGGYDPNKVMQQRTVI